MTISINAQIEKLQDLRLPELQEKFREVVGKKTRSPNKKFLLRRIRESLETQTQAEPISEPEPHSGSDETELQSDRVVTFEVAISDEGEEPKAKERSAYSIPELQALYREVVGRDTGSSNAAYLKWKIQQARKGRVPVGPIERKKGSGTSSDFKILPLRFPLATVEALDGARKRLGLSNRMVLFRNALSLYLTQAGENEVAALFIEPSLSPATSSASNTEMPPAHTTGSEAPTSQNE